MSLLLLTAKKKFTPLALFRNSEQGAWYDPSDLTTLFQDSSGTTPVTLSPMEQPVGLMLDKSKGLVVSTVVTANTFGVSPWNTPASGTVSNGIWSGMAQYTTINLSTTLTTGKRYRVTGIGSTTGSAGIHSLSGTNYGSFSSSFDYYFIATNPILVIQSNVASISINLTSFIITEVLGNHAFQTTAGNRPLLSARVNLLLATTTLSTQSVTTVATNYVLAFSGAGTVTLSGTATGVLSAGSNTFTATAGTLTLTVSGSVTLADLRPTNSGALLPAYQRVNTATDYDTVGFPLYLKCNGSSSAMSTNSINFTATDKMTVVTGLRKLSDAATGIFIEHGVGGIDARAWTISAPRSSVNQNYGTDLRDGVNTTCTVNTSSFPSPTSNTITVLFDYAGVYESKIRINNSAFFTNTTNLTGNFANYPLYLFSRSTSTPTAAYNFYGAIIRGAQSDTDSVTQTENYMAQKTGITF